MVHGFFLILGLAMLIKGADLLVKGSASLAKKCGISGLVIGLTVVAFGTSLPELIISIFASFKGKTDLILGNIIGSNISNILLILGLTSVLSTLPVRRSMVWREIPFSLLAILILALLGADTFFYGGSQNIITQGDGIILLLFFMMFLYYVASMSNREENCDIENNTYTNFRIFSMIFLGLSGLFFGGQMLVDGAIAIANLFDMSERAIGLTIVAVGTSLPELVTSVVAAKKGHKDIAVGNIVGSNIFNIFWILGVSSLIHPISIETGSHFDILVCIGATILLFLALFFTKKNQLERWQGVVFVMIYSAYITYVVLQ